MKKRALFIFPLALSLLMSGCKDGTTFYSNVLRSDVYYQVYTISKVDILFVVDQSLTMQPRLTTLKSQLANFMTMLNSRKAVDYSISVTTVDLFTQGCNLVSDNQNRCDATKFGQCYWQVPGCIRHDSGVVTPGCGTELGGTNASCGTGANPDCCSSTTQLDRQISSYQAQCRNCNYDDPDLAVTAHDFSGCVIKPTDSAPVTKFTNILNNVSSTSTDFWEQGRECSLQATQTYGSQFRRAGTPFMVIYMSDERDWSCQGNCFGVEPENNVDWIPYDTSRYIDYFANLGKAESTIVTLYPVVGLNYTDCSVATVGDNQIATAEGVASAFQQKANTQSICQSKLTDSFLGIAKDIADRGLVFKLSSQASGQGINVFVNGVLIPFSTGYWQYNATNNTIEFTSLYAPPLNAVVEFTYSQDVI